MSLQADLDALWRAAAGFDGIANEIRYSHIWLQSGRDRASEFGHKAISANVGAEHDKFIESMLDALEQGKRTQKKLADILSEVAKDYGSTDENVSDTFHKPDGTPRG